MSTTMIPEGHRLTGAMRGAYPVPVYDDGGDGDPLFILRDSTGILGIVRAFTWEDAFSICEDEFFPEADETMEEIVKEYGFRRTLHKVIRDPSAVAGQDPGCAAGERWARHPEDYTDNGMLPRELFVRWDTHKVPDPEAWADNELFQESYGFRPNGRNSTDKIGHGIYAKDLNGESLYELGHRTLAELGIVLTTEPW